METLMGRIFDIQVYTKPACFQWMTIIYVYVYIIIYYIYKDIYSGTKTKVHVQNMKYIIYSIYLMYHVYQLILFHW